MNWFEKVLFRVKSGDTAHPADLELEPVYVRPTARFKATRLGDGFRAFALNNLGQIVGELDEQATLFTPGKGYTPLLPELRNERTIANSINDRGDIVAFSMKSGWAGLFRDGSWIDLPEGSDYKLNQRGQLFFMRDSVKDPTSWLWEDGEIAQVGPVGFVGVCFNDHGTVGGWLEIDEKRSLPGLCTGAEFTAVETPEAVRGGVEAINNAGHMFVWYRITEDHEPEAELRISGEARPILPCEALWIDDVFMNEKGWMVGNFNYPAGIPYVYGQAEFVYDGKSNYLSHVVQERIGFTMLRGINDLGQILAEDEEQSYLVEPLERV